MADEILSIKISALKPHPDNPRIVRDERFKTLVKSITDFPEMLKKRPLIAYTDPTNPKKYIVIGGNQRLKAATEVGLKEIPVQLADDWTEDQRDEFMIKDNVLAGQWDLAALTNNWEAEGLKDWGMDLPEFEANFTPSFNPGAAQGDITQDQLNAADKRLKDSFIQPEAEKYQVTCPHCANEFYIDKN